MKLLPCFIISLPDCIDRRSRISKLLLDIGLSFEFFDAVDGRNGLDEYSERQIDRDASMRLGEHMSSTEFACALTHINIYRKIIADMIPYAVILEDDVTVSSSLINFLAGKHYQDADLTQIYSPDHQFYVSRRGAKRLPDGYTSYLRTPHLRCPGTCGYVISYEAAKHLVENAVPVCQHADWPDCLQSLIAKRRCRVIYPTLVRHPKPEDKGWTSVIHPSGRKSNKESRRFLGVYIPPFRKMIRSYRRAPLKLIYKRLPCQ